MTNLVDIYKEIGILRKEIELQNRLVEHWEGRWEQEYLEKIELLHENIELKKKYEGIPEEVRNKFELVHSPSRIAFQDISNNQEKMA